MRHDWGIVGETRVRQSYERQQCVKSVDETESRIRDADPISFTGLWSS